MTFIQGLLEKFERLPSNSHEQLESLRTKLRLLLSYGGRRVLALSVRMPWELITASTWLACSTFYLCDSRTYVPLSRTQWYANLLLKRKHVTVTLFSCQLVIVSLVWMTFLYLQSVKFPCYFSHVTSYCHRHFLYSVVTNNALLCCCEKNCYTNNRDKSSKSDYNDTYSLHHIVVRCIFLRARGIVGPGSWLKNIFWVAKKVTITFSPCYF